MAKGHGRQSRPKDTLRCRIVLAILKLGKSPQSTSSVRGGCQTASRRAAFGLVDTTDARGANRPTQSWRSRLGRAARRADLPSSPMRLSRTLRQQTGAMGRAMCCRVPPIRLTEGRVLDRCVEHTEECSFLCVCSFGFLSVSLSRPRRACFLTLVGSNHESAQHCVTEPAVTHFPTPTVTHLSETSALHSGSAFASSTAPLTLSPLLFKLQWASNGALILACRF